MSAFVLMSVNTTDLLLLSSSQSGTSNWHRKLRFKKTVCRTLVQTSGGPNIAKREMLSKLIHTHTQTLFRGIYRLDFSNECLNRKP